MSGGTRLRGGRAFLEAVVHEDSPLTTKARLVAVTLDAYTHHKTGAVIMPVSRISNLTGLSGRSVDRAVAELNDKGYVRVRKVWVKGGDSPLNEYRMRVPEPFDWSTPPGGVPCGLASRIARRELLSLETSWRGAVAVMAALYWVDREGVVVGSLAQMAETVGASKRSLVRWVPECEVLRRRDQCDGLSTGVWGVHWVLWESLALGSYWPREDPSGAGNSLGGR